MKYQILPLLILLSQIAYSQHTLSGKITDIETGETLVGATIYNPGAKQGTSSNAYGFYSLNLPGGKQQVVFSFVGYEPQTVFVDLKTDSILNIGLSSDNVLSEVTVTESRRQYFLSGVQMGENRLTAREIENLPVVLGETDVLKAIQSLPGVNAGNDGTAGISVRGGSPDQTLILLDEVPVYNVNHLFGYFSVFNNDAIKEANLIKGTIPAQYGGRLSSVLDIRMKEGNLKEHTGKASLSTLSGKYTIEGPIIKGKASYMLSGRATWLDLPLRLYFYLTDNDMKVYYSFWDLNGKANFEFSNSDRLFVSFYGGNDEFFVGNEEGNYFAGNSNTKYQFSWGNYTASARWNHIFNSKLFSNLTAYFSRYNYSHLYEMKSTSDTLNIDTYSSLADASLKYDFDYYPDNAHKIKFGTKLSYLFFQPEKTDLDTVQAGLISHYQAPVVDLYANDEFLLCEKLRVSAGLRLSTLKRGEKYEFHLMPRFSACYPLSSSLSLKAGYSIMVQHLHQLTNPSLSLPTTMWVLSNASLESSSSNLSSIGLYYMNDKGLELSGEAYFNTMDKVIDYKPGKENFKINEDQWGESVMVGEGFSYGIELFAKYRHGSYSGQLSYTYSRSYRKYDELAYVGYYPYMFDRPHNISLQITKEFETSENAKFNKRLSLNFNYMSGPLISFSNYTIPAILPDEFEGYKHHISDFNYYIPHPNNVRLPAVHHLDLSFHLENKTKEKSSWVFSIYNIYNRKNISFYYVQNDQIKGAALLPIIPSVTWNFKF